MQCIRYQRDRTYLEDLEPGDIQDSDEELAFVLCVQGFIDTSYQPLEHAVIDGLGQGVQSVQHLVLVLTFGHVFISDLDLW